MTAWQQLKANSALAAGTAWELLTHPRVGHIYNDAIRVEVQDGVLVTRVSIDPVHVELEPQLDVTAVGTAIVTEYQIPAAVAVV